MSKSSVKKASAVHAHANREYEAARAEVNRLTGLLKKANDASWEARARLDTARCALFEASVSDG